MSKPNSRVRDRVTRVVGFIAVVLVFAIAIWIDLTTGLWQQAVILSGIAAGLLTFLLTALFFDRWVTAADHRRWYPVTHLALTDLLHELADEETSRISRGIVTPRTIDDSGDHADVLASIHHERQAITRALARWAGFLAASADVQRLMDLVAALPLRLDAARDAVIDAEQSPDSADAADAMRTAIDAVNSSISGAVAEIDAAIDVFVKAQR